MYEDVKLVNAPPSGRWGHYDIAIFKFNGTWYALTSSFSAGTILWRINGPTSREFIYVKTIFEKGHENPTIYPVIDSQGQIMFAASFATDTEFGSRHRIYIFDTDFSIVEKYDIIGYRVWSAGTTFFLDPWYTYINQDQTRERVFSGSDIWPGAYIEVYKLNTNYVYYIEE
ncbi:MAG: hypothetical protein QW348_02550 [Ignisphaera sp.]